MNRAQLIILIYTVSILILSTVYVYLTVELAIGNVMYATMREELDTLRKKNMLLKERVYEKSSLTTIEREARKRGMVDGVYYYIYVKPHQ